MDSPSPDRDLDASLNTPAFVQDPYPIYCRFRCDAPVHWSPSWRCWLLTRYDDVASSLRDFRCFSSVGTITRYLDQLPVAVLEQIQPIYQHFSSGLVRRDPPDHTEARGLTNKAFTPRVVETMRQRIEQLVQDMIDAVMPTGRIDLIADLAYPLPTTVIADMFGFPKEDRAAFKHWSDEIAAFHGTGGADADTVKRSQTALLEARAWMGNLIADRRRQPADDLLSRLANAEDQGARLNDTELFANCVTFMIGGHETTTNLIGNGMLALLQSPEQMQLLAKNPGLVDSAVEEMLRYDAPTQRAHRIAAANIEVRGRLIKKGDLVQMVLGSANRDPDQFDQPDEFHIERQANKHLSFGVGPHYCPGAPLARLEAKIVIRSMLDRMMNLRLEGQGTLEFGPNNFFRGLKSLPLEFEKK